MFIYMYKSVFSNRHVPVSIILNLHYLQYVHVSIVNRVYVWKATVYQRETFLFYWKGYYGLFLFFITEV